MKKKLLIATHNKAKIKWLSKFLENLPLELASLSDLNITTNIEEDRKTYIENSQKKALFYAKLTGIPAVADDGGLEIDALNGEPGVKSRRWLGYEATDEELIEHMKKVSKKLPDNNRGAQYKVVISFAMPNNRVWSVEGVARGIIAKKPHTKPETGFPYNAFFFIPGLEKFYQDLLLFEDQKKYNHRYKAIEKLKPIIQNVILSETKNLERQ